MKTNHYYVEAALLALGLIVMGSFLKMAIDGFTNKDRKVTVKGLAEREVEADRVTWPIATKEVGNDLQALYEKINHTNAAIKAFLLQGGIKESEISVNAPTVIDMNAERYSSNQSPNRYNITSTITVASPNVKLVRAIMAKQGELLKQGIAIVEDGYENAVKYELAAFKDLKPDMMRDAIANAETTAQQFAEHSHSRLNKIMNADQGQFSIENRDENTPYIKKVRVVTTVTYSLRN